ncbi:hypothetical protein INT44_005247 [Umbelopsis vinacea]|uniref:FAS1 domain-containing protein n=1 Tax=Umbelopsis vinacea TaxID=44442 RepID=A0A8H7Q9A0_9FUNG|nr:hypothetical protein INT44_005247 [Umbelopsis vinacea]KAI9287232.1 FAS1 domain-containing protein [Umbelopsis sp. AD052]
MKILLILALLVEILPVFALKTIIDVLAGDARFKEFLGHVRRTGLASEIDNLRKATVFAPTNDAFKDAFKDDKDITKEQILYHLGRDQITGKDFFNGQIVESLYIRDEYLGSDAEGQRIRITQEGKKGDIYVGEAKITDFDFKAANGVIHAIDKLMPVPRTLTDSLSKIDDLRDFNDLVHKSKVSELLSEPRPFTVFAPKGDILSNFTSIEKAYLLSHEGREDLTSIVERHIHDGAFYAKQFPEGKGSLDSIQGEKIKLDVKDADEIYVDGVRLTSKDKIAANGVFHEIEDLIIPKAINFNLRKHLIGMNATKFVSLVDEAGLGHYLEDSDNSYTILAPLNEALDLDEVPRKYLKNWLSYHILKGQWMPNNFTDGQLLKTESRSDELDGRKQRLKVYVENSRLIADDHKSITFGRSGVAAEPAKSDDNVVYLLSRSLKLPEDIISTLPLNLDLSTFVATIYATGSRDVINNAKGITLFAPSNAAFERLGLVTKYLLLPEEQSKKKLQTLLTYHATKEIFYTDNMRVGAVNAQTLAGADITVNKTEDGEILLRGIGAKDGSDRSTIAKVFESDTLVSNGVMHKIDRVELPHNIQISVTDILKGVESSTFMAIFQKANLSDFLEDDRDYTILAPTDRAWSRINLTALLTDHERLQRVARLHILKSPIKKGNSDSLLGDDREYPTLLSDDDKIGVRQVSDSHYVLDVKGSLGGDGSSSRVLGYGQTTSGGGVIQLEEVLIPKGEPTLSPHKGLKWWQILLIVLGAILGLILLAAIGFFAWQWYQKRRGGYIALGDDH